VDLALLDGVGNVIAQSSRGPGAVDTVKARNTSPFGANWTVRVTHVGGGTGAGGGYTVVVGY
jgi:hypothetical protein